MVNITDIEAINGTWFGAIQFINNSTGGSFIPFVLIGLWFILVFILTMKAGFLEGITSASFAMFVISLIFQAFGGADFMLVLSFFGLTVIMGFFLYMRGKMS